jgi:hypothetical protein
VIGGGIGFFQGWIALSPGGIDAIKEIGLCSAAGSAYGAVLGVVIFGFLRNRIVHFIDFSLLVSAALICGVAAAGLLVLLFKKPAVWSIYFAPLVAVLGSEYLRTHRPRSGHLSNEMLEPLNRDMQKEIPDITGFAFRLLLKVETIEIFLLKLAAVEVASIIVGAGIGFLAGCFSFSSDGIHEGIQMTFFSSLVGSVFGACAGGIIFGSLQNRAVDFIDFSFLISVTLFAGIAVCCVLILLYWPALAVLDGAERAGDLLRMIPLTAALLTMFFSPVVALFGSMYLRFGRPKLTRSPGEDFERPSTEAVVS